MQLLAVGLNHTTAPVSLREQLALAPDQLGQAVQAARGWFARTDPLAAYMSQSSLFGELAASDDFHARLTTTVVGLETWLVQPEQPLAVV